MQAWGFLLSLIVLFFDVNLITQNNSSSISQIRPKIGLNLVLWPLHRTLRAIIFYQSYQNRQALNLAAHAPQHEKNTESESKRKKTNLRAIPDLSIKSSPPKYKSAASRPFFSRKIIFFTNFSHRSPQRSQLDRFTQNREFHIHLIRNRTWINSWFEFANDALYSKSKFFGRVHKTSSPQLGESFITFQKKKGQADWEKEWILTDCYSKERRPINHTFL